MLCRSSRAELASGGIGVVIGLPSRSKGGPAFTQRRETKSRPDASTGNGNGAKRAWISFGAANTGQRIAVRIEDGGSGQIVTDDVDAAVAVTGEIARRSDSSDELVIAAGGGESMHAAVAGVGDPDPALRIDDNSGGSPGIHQAFGRLPFGMEAERGQTADLDGISGDDRKRKLPQIARDAVDARR